MKIPKTTQGTGVGSNEIPSWIKNNAGWWADGTIDDESFIQGIQFLIKEGIMKVPQPRQSNTSSGAEPEAWYNQRLTDGWLIQATKAQIKEIS